MNVILHLSLVGLIYTSNVNILFVNLQYMWCSNAYGEKQFMLAETLSMNKHEFGEHIHCLIYINKIHKQQVKKESMHSQFHTRVCALCASTINRVEDRKGKVLC